MAVAVIFPGQGTQGPGMGLPWRDHPAWAIVERAETALGEPLAHLLMVESADELARTREAQLSVLLSSLLAWEAVRDTIPRPVAFAGHSLGQMAALIASGSLGFDDGIRLVAARGELTQRAADRNPGRMVALMGADEAQAQEVCDAAPDECWVANDNAPGQIVLAGTLSGVEQAQKAAETIGIRRVIPLRVAGAFHTPLMSEAAEGLASVLAQISFTDPLAPIVSNADAALHADGPGWRARLAAHLVSPVRWRASMVTMAEKAGASRFLEVGFGSMLATLAKRCTPGLPVHGVGSPADVASLTEVT